MPALTNPRWESACQLRANGGEVRVSYEKAGYTGQIANAVRFFKQPHIVERVQEIVQERYEDERKAREIATQEAGIDKAWVLKRLKYLTDISLQKIEIVRRGRVIGQGAMDGPTAVKCLTLATQIGGLVVQRHEIGAPGDFQRMSDEELSDSLAAQAEALGIPEDAIAGLLTHRGGTDETENNS
jgi:hypothetical protein